MSTVDWNKVKFRASSWGNLLSEPVSKADKEAGKLGITCQKELLKIYSQEVYGRKKDITTKHMDKGKQAEQDSITMLSIVDGELYSKNDEKIENDYFSGHPDIFTGESITNAILVGDIKTSWELDTFLPKLIEKPDPTYVAQLNCYYDLTGAQGGFIAYCLADCPINILEQEKRSLLFKMNVATELAPEYIAACEELERLLTFPDIPIEEKVIKIPVPRDETLIEKMRSKVPIFREWLQNFHEKHMNLYPKQ